MGRLLAFYGRERRERFKNQIFMQMSMVSGAQLFLFTVCTMLPGTKWESSVDRFLCARAKFGCREHS